MSAPPPTAGCPRCGTPYAPGQEYCLECGLRLPVRAPFLGGLTGWWARRSVDPGSWIWRALALLVLAALGALVAILVSRGGGTKETIVATSQVVLQTTPRTTLPSRRPRRRVPVPAATTPPPATAAPTTLPTAPLVTTTGPSGLTTWAAADGYTIVLSSVPTGTGRASAERTAKHALARGLPQVGILDSKDFSSLHPGYFVIFSGLYGSQAAATASVPRAKSAGFASAYARRITR